MISPGHRFFVPLLMCACFVSAFAGAALAMRWIGPGFVTTTALPPQETAPALQAVPGCEDEAEQWCPHTKISEGGTIGCLMDFEDKWSATCRMALKPYLNRWVACESDIKRFCPGIKMGRLRIPKCLAPHASELGAACRAALQK